MNNMNIQNGLVPSATSAPKQSSPTVAASGGPSFQALLEKLEGQAQGLGAQANGPEGMDDLGGAVADARTSLNAALDLGRDLLEAYREAHLDKAG